MAVLAKLQLDSKQMAQIERKERVSNGIGGSAIGIA